MDIKIPKGWSILNVLKVSLLLVTFSGCPSDEGRRCMVGNNNTYKFQLEVDVNPIETIYEVGDTLSVVISFSESIFDLTTQGDFILPRDYAYMSNSLVRFADSVRDDNIAFMIDTVVTVLNLQDLNNEYGSFINRGFDGNTSLLSQFVFDEEDLIYSFKYQIKLDKPGLYVLENSSNIGDTDLFGPLEIEGICKDAAISSVVTLNEAAQSNFFLLEGTEVPLYINTLIERELTRFDEFGSFVFKVE